MGHLSRQLLIRKYGYIYAGQKVLEKGFVIASRVERGPAARPRYKFTSVAFLPSSFALSS